MNYLAGYPAPIRLSNMQFSLIAALVLLARAFAQNVSHCASECLAQAVHVNGCNTMYGPPFLRGLGPMLISWGLRRFGRTDVQCLCTNLQVQKAALSCLQQNCTTQDLQATASESPVQSECTSEHQSISLSRIGFLFQLLVSPLLR